MNELFYGILRMDILNVRLSKHKIPGVSQPGQCSPAGDEQPLQHL